MPLFLFGKAFFCEKKPSAEQKGSSLRSFRSVPSFLLRSYLRSHLTLFFRIVIIDSTRAGKGLAGLFHP